MIGTTSYILLILYAFSTTTDQISLIIYRVDVKSQLNGARTSGLVELLLIIQCKALQQCSYLICSLFYSDSGVSCLLILQEKNYIIPDKMTLVILSPIN